MDIASYIFENHMVRKSKKQKTAFLDWAQPFLEEQGYTVRRETPKNAKPEKAGNVNLVIGDPDTAKVIFGGHYDTQPVMPFPNFLTPKNFLVYLLYQIVITVVLLAVPVVIGWLLHEFTPLKDSAALIAYIIFWVEFCLMMFGPANKTTVNDNTSGVVTVMEAALAMPEELRDKVAFVLFDNEEKGLVGSHYFNKQHKKALKESGGVVVNFDCVAMGDWFLIVPQGKTKKDAALCDAMAESFASYIPHKNVEVVRKGFCIYPSDQSSFKKAFGVAAFKKSPVVGLYMDRIHTPRDTVYERENIAMLTAGAVRFARQLGED